MHAGGSNCMPCCSRTKTPRGWVISQVGHGESKVTKEACVSQKRSKTRSGPSDSTILPAYRQSLAERRGWGGGTGSNRQRPRGEQETLSSAGLIAAMMVTVGVSRIT